jgi:hypothetical protein
MPTISMFYGILTTFSGANMGLRIFKHSKLSMRH